MRYMVSGPGRKTAGRPLSQHYGLGSGAVSEQTKQQMVALLPRLRRFAYALSGTRDEADDLVQAACERALSRLDQWQAGTRLDSWMFRIIQNAWIDRTRAARVRGAPYDPDDLVHLPGVDGRRVTEAALTLDAVRRRIGELPEEQRIALALVTVDGMSYQQAADVLQVPIGTVTSRLSRARKRLAEELSEEIHHDRNAGAGRKGEIVS